MPSFCLEVTFSFAGVTTMRRVYLKKAITENDTATTACFGVA